MSGRSLERHRSIGLPSNRSPQGGRRRFRARLFVFRCGGAMRRRSPARLQGWTRGSSVECRVFGDQPSRVVQILCDLRVGGRCCEGFSPHNCFGRSGRLDAVPFEVKIVDDPPSPYTGQRLQSRGSASFKSIATINLRASRSFIIA